MADDDVGVVPTLALPPPLERGLPLLAPEQQKTFDVDAFLCSRVYGQDVQTIAKELRTYSQTLQERLVQFVHTQYRDFVALASVLQAEAVQIRALTDGPELGEVHETLRVLRASLRDLEEQIVQEREASMRARKDKRNLNALLDLDVALERILSMLQGASGTPMETAAWDAALARGSLAELSGDSQMHTTQGNVETVTEAASLFERVSDALREYTWAAHLLATVEGEAYAPFLAGFAPRLDAVQRTLNSEAHVLLCDALRDAVALDKLEVALQTFHALGTETAPVLDQVARQLVVPRLAQAMQGVHDPHGIRALDVGVYADDEERARLHTLTSLDFGPPADAAAGCFLVRVLNGMLALAAELAPVCAVAERVGGASLDVFNRALWRTAAARLVDEHGAALFFVGRPDAFHRNYTLLQHFRKAFVGYAPSARARRAFADDEATQMLERRWQLSAFFHLRARDTVTALEAALRAPVPEAGFEHGACARLLYAFLLPWRATRHVPVLAAREWRLSLHVLSRYATWLAAAVRTIEKEPIQADPPGAKDEVPALQRHAALLADAQLLEARIRAAFSDYLLPKIVLPTDASEAAATVRAALHEALDASLDHAAPLAPRIGAVLVNALQRRCAEPLRHVRAGSSQYRALGTPQPAEAQPSAYVPQIVEPLRQFFEGALVARVAQPLREEWARAVLDATLARYTTAVETITHNLASLRRLKRGSSALHEDAGADAGVYAQLRLDVDALRAEVDALAAHTQLCLVSDRWAALEACVAAGAPEVL